MDASMLFVVFIVTAIFVAVISYNRKRLSTRLVENDDFMKRPTAPPMDRDRIIASLGLDASDDRLDEVVEAARKVYNDVHDCVIAGNISEEVADFLARLSITNPYLIKKSQFKAILDLERLMDKGAVHNEDGSLWNLQLLNELMESIADFLLEKVDSPVSTYEESQETTGFGVKFGVLETLVEGAGEAKGADGPFDSTSAFLREKAEEEEARMIDEEYFEWWIVHQIIREEERRREETPDRSIFTHKDENRLSSYEQDLSYDEAYDEGDDEEEVYDDYDSYWDQYDAGDMDDMDLDD